MAESSRFWNNTGDGDGPALGYGPALISGWLRSVFSRNTRSGVLRRTLNELAVSGSTSPLSVASGAAVVDGIFYENTAALSLAVATPVVGTTGGRVALRASWAAQTVRAVVLLSADGTADLPTLTQVSETTYEVGLASFTIATDGAITITDTRDYAAFASINREYDIEIATTLSVLARASAGAGVSAALAASADHQVLQRLAGALIWAALTTDGIENQAITNAKLRDSAALSVIGRAAGTLGAPADIQAAADGVLARIAGELLFAQAPAAWFSGFSDIPTAKLASGAVDDTKAGDRIIQLRKRQYIGGINYDVSGVVRLQAGVLHVHRDYDYRAEGQAALPEAVTGNTIMLCTLTSSTLANLYTAHVSVIWPGTSFYYDIWVENGWQEIDCNLNWLLIEMR